MKKGNWKFQKHGTRFVTCLHFLFLNLSSKPHGCPLKEADVKAVKVVKFATKWLNLYPHTVCKTNKISSHILLPNQGPFLYPLGTLMNWAKSDFIVQLKKYWSQSSTWRRIFVSSMQIRTEDPFYPAWPFFLNLSVKNGQVFSLNEC